MDQVACPVCTLFLREGMSLKNHLYTHPKNQVIDALVRLTCSHAEKTISLNRVPEQRPVVPQHQVTSITYQHFLSSTTSFVNPPLTPPGSVSPHVPKITNAGCPQRDFPVQQLPEICYPETYPSTRSANSAIKYTQMENYARNEQPVGGVLSSLANDIDRSLAVDNNSSSFIKPNSKDIHRGYDEHNKLFPGPEIGSVITDTHRVITSSPVPPVYNNFSNDPKAGWEETVPTPYQSDEAHSPNASRGSVCSVRVRKDLGDHSSGDDNTLIQLTPPRGEFILPCFDYGDENCEDDEDHFSDDSPNSIPLNIHTDESMPPRGELSGQGTNSSIWQADRENITPFDGLHDDQWRNMSNENRERHNCSECNKDFSTLQEWRMHISIYHQHPVITESTPPADTMPPSQQDTFSSVFVKAEKVCVIEEVKKVKDEPNTRDGSECKSKIRRRPPRTCKTCGMSFTCSDDFKSHIRKVHPLECTVCGKCFLRNSGLTLHQKRHLRIKPYKCDLCDKSFVTNQKLKEHHYTHTGEKPLKCQDCPQTFKRYSNLIQHKQSVHLKIKKKTKDFYCCCGEVFHTKKKLAWHQETHDTKPKQCLYCNERFVHNASLTRHIRRSHDSSYLSNGKTDMNVNVECPICHRIFLKGSLRNHILIHSGMKPYSCSTCGKKFLSKWNMKLHQWTHTARASKPYRCKLCKAAFVRQNLFQIHLRSHKNVRPYSCNHCGRQFTHKYNCIRHVREHAEKKPFRCEVCGKQFHRSYYLKDHMKVHTGVKPYSCHICSKTTATKTNHNKHLKTHHAREPVNSEH